MDADPFRTPSKWLPLKVIATTFLVVVVPAGIIGHQMDKAREQRRADALKQIAREAAERASAEAERRAAPPPSHPTPTYQQLRAQAAVEEETVDSNEMSAVTEQLRRLSRNPRALHPTSVAPPTRGERHTTYEYIVAGVGNVIQWRTDANHWSLFLPGQTSAIYFGSTAALKPLTPIGPAAWWRVVAGPFTDSFVLLSPGGIEVRSTADVCDVSSTLDAIPSVASECSGQ